MTVNDSNLRKLFQMQLYTFLSSRWGMCALVFGLMICCVALLQIVHVLLSGHFDELRCLRYGYGDHSNVSRGGYDLADNLIGIPDVDVGPDGPIDVVYTWVNGSDPRQIAALKAYQESIKIPAKNLTECTKKTPAKELCLCTNTTAPKHCVNATAPAKVDDAASASRFIDNQEFKYSLRSVQKYAPWVRRIFVVTNGQVPSWLNINHPRITVVAHREIFVNQSHLPTFSSPAIECHLHRIPGLAPRFIYMNDDVMFGARVTPADFATPQRGQRIYLSWPVPDCAPGCPSSWLGDGYCDLACDVDECSHDAGDCEGDKGKNERDDTGAAWWNAGGLNNRWQQDGARGGGIADTCAPGCPDSWVGDKYCDALCNTQSCAFDGADCSINDIFRNVTGFALTIEDDEYVVPKGVSVAYFNMSVVIAEQHITDGSHERPDLIRTATISQQHKLLVITVQTNVTKSTVTFTVVAQAADNKLTEYQFNVTVDTSIASINKSTNQHNITNSSKNATPTTILISSNNNNADDEDELDLKDENNNYDNSKKDDDADYIDAEEEPIPKRGGVINRSRKLLDTFGDSLKFVNSLYTKLYGSEARRVPAHMPHFITRDIVTELHAKFPKQFEATSSHHLRRGDDMQFSFSYMYFIRHEPAVVEFSTIFKDYLDNDIDGALNWNELRTLAAFVYGVPLRFDDVDRLYRLLDHCVPPPNSTTSVIAKSTKSASKSADADDGDDANEEDEEEEVENDDSTKDDNDNNDDDHAAKYRDDGDDGGYDDDYEAAADDHRATNHRRLQALGAVDPNHRHHRNDDNNHENDDDEEEEQLAYANFDDDVHDAKRRQHDAEQHNENNNNINASSSATLPTTTIDLSTLVVNETALIDHESFKKAFEAEIQAAGAEAAKFHRNGSLPSIDDPYVDSRLNVEKEKEEDKWKTGTPGGANWRNWADRYNNRDNDDEKNNKKNATEETIKRIAARNGRDTARRSIAAVKARWGGGQPLESIRVPFESIQRCSRVVDKLMKHFKSKPKYASEEILDSPEVAFLMVTTNDTKLQERLDGIRVARQKFICLNDNLQHADNHSRSAVELLHNFYEAMFPIPSAFELAPNVTNPELYIDELRSAARHERLENVRWGLFALIASGVLAFCAIRWRRQSLQSRYRSDRESAHRRFMSV